MDKELFHFVANSFIEHKVTVVLANYPLAPAASMDEIVNSCRRAMIWLYHHISNYNGSPNKIYTSGHSAGGHLVAMLAATDWKTRGTHLPADLIKGGCAISGLFNLTPIRLSYLNDVLDMDQAAAQRNSPVNLLPSCHGPFIVFVGGLESDEYHAQSEELIRVWSQAGMSLNFLPLGEANHFSILDQLAQPEKTLSQAVLNQMLVELNATTADS